jgi:hypothetical protein
MEGMEGMKVVESEDFRGCQNLLHVFVRDCHELREIDGFRDCPRLESIEIQEHCRHWTGNRDRDFWSICPSHSLQSGANHSMWHFQPIEGKTAKFRKLKND